ncbi:peamaclein-like [Diospyros lotus]|uniref:peamaclein-like n=1 Tax=Diospyros lotus TaxID=55363 RepID=UPI002259A57F|nr:peamaclein-like [Diospyros lotus]
MQRHYRINKQTCHFELIHERNCFSSDDGGGGGRLFTSIASSPAAARDGIDTGSGGSSSWCDCKCAVRCSKSGRKERCLKYCGICCEKCHCVPSGTFGNKDECPCYRDMKNSKGKPKCP